MKLRAAICCALLAAAGFAHADIGLNIYGASYHFERAKARELGLTNEVNPGLGLRWRTPYRETMDLFADTGFYRDSARHTALLAGGGVFLRLTEALRLGGALVLFKSPTYNDGDPFIAPVPLAAYEWHRLTFNVVYFPKVGELNSINQVGFWLTAWLF